VEQHDTVVRAALLERLRELSFALSATFPGSLVLRTGADRRRHAAKCAVPLALPGDAGIA
jgi:hypothetical protein